MKTNEYWIQQKSQDGSTYEIRILAVIPEYQILGYLQIVHDMYDTISRYQDVMKQIAKSGYLVFGHDMVGHGKSANGNYGKMGHVNVDNLIDDIHDVYLKILKKYPPNLDPIVFHHSNGKNMQFIRPQLHGMIGIGAGCALIRASISKYKDFNAVLMIGDPGFRGLYQETLHHAKRKGWPESQTQLIHEWNEGTKANNNTSYRNSYRFINKQKIREANADDSINFMYDHESFLLWMSLLTQYSLSQWMTIHPKYLPLYEISGYLDPINNFTREIDNILEHFKKSACKNIYYRYYENRRHDILLDDKNQEVIKNLIYFFNRINEELIKQYNIQKEMLEKRGWMK